MTVLAGDLTGSRAGRGPLGSTPRPRGGSTCRACRLVRPVLLRLLILVLAVLVPGRALATDPEPVVQLWTSATSAVRIDVPGALRNLLPTGVSWRRGVIGYPTAGFEAASERLLPAVTAPVPSDGYALGRTQTAADGSTVPVGWSPCRPIHYVVATDGAPDGFVQAVDAVARSLSAATGLALVDDGATTEPVDPLREGTLPERYGDRWAPVLIGFADESTVPDLAGAVLGRSSTTTARDRRTDDSFLVSGAVHLDREILGMTAVDGGPMYLAVLRHELAHVLGLGHVDDPAQLMNTTAAAVSTFQPGDLAGLATVGAGMCSTDL